MIRLTRVDRHQMCNTLKNMVFLAALICEAPVASSAEDLGGRPDFQFALLKYTGGNWNPRPHGLTRLAWEVRKRTSIAVELEVAGVDPTQDAVFDYPLLVWEGDAAFPTLPADAVAKLRQHLLAGGTLVIDISDGNPTGPFYSSVERELKRIFPERSLGRVPTDHVVYKSFYLVDRHGGRVSAQPFLLGIFIEDRLAVILSANDLAGAMSRDGFGQWEYDVGAGGETAREMTFRLGLNIVMYALCHDYQDDQVHLPYILKRRR
jgi:hypothetical protein